MASQITSNLTVCSTICSAKKNKVNIKATSLCEGNALVTNGFHAQRANNAENISMLWHPVSPTLTVVLDICQIYWPIHVLISYLCGCHIDHPSHRDHFVFAPSQWETTLHCYVVSHWLGAYTKLPLLTQYHSSSLSAIILWLAVRTQFHPQKQMIFYPQHNMGWAQHIPVCNGLGEIDLSVRQVIWGEKKSSKSCILFWKKNL